MENKHCTDIQNSELTNRLNHSIESLVKSAMKIAMKDFSSAKNIANILLKQKNTGTTRRKYEDEGVHVPPFMIASITSTCNLNCKGCYDKAKHHNLSLELDEKQWSDIFNQARDLGMSFILLAGGEPLTKENVIMECIKYPEIIFPIFTNGILIDETLTKYFVKSRNIIPVVSIEGDMKQTDNRRGTGVFEKISSNLNMLKKNNILFGISITLTCENYDTVINENFIKQYIDKGCRLFFFVEYVPFDTTTENLVVKDEQKNQLDRKLEKLREKFNVIMFDFPGDEKVFGGCLAAGRGFVHVNAMGQVEACPFAPYSDVNLKNTSLKEALKSPILNEIRNIDKALEQHKGGCALFANREMVQEALKK